MQLRQSIPLLNNPSPIVIIGAGGIVTDAHLPAYSKAGWKVLGIYDRDLEKAKAAKVRFPFVSQTFSILDDLVQVGFKENAVFDLAVPADQILSVLEKIPDHSAVLIQKPMGETLEEAQKILAVCQEKNLVAAVNFQLKFAPYMLALQDLMERGILGEVYDIELKVCVHTPWELWDFLKTKPRMEVLYHSVHYLDLIRALAGNPSRVSASLARHPKSPDLADARSSILLDYPESKQARILTNHGHSFGGKHQQSYLKVEGTQGAAFIQLGLSLDYPKGRPSYMEYFENDSELGWQEIPLQGDWFPEAFVGSMAVLQNHLQDPSLPLIHSVGDALQTMELVELVYQNSRI
ncbi:Gfo/Idh/MocA family oxidoreductase [Algoriphagus aestuariicola]|uniref:Gfo/Idh/MocA family oxidoreductase n=1 Tax=Algoriphagus aestuariicola TaxID=1852016 RepID=A0ABS3BSG4_9BACT|nr:Gfo/Idh/MocA family oxidoreductase [Algoriphagus aestuariicola]MBN7802224.1 Gfo/Idh/MocA family oxidoreductase [Algoriphagus aestuariicola]